MRRIALVRLLLPYVAGTNLRRIAHPQLVTQLAQQIHQPVTVAGGFHADQRRRRYSPVEPFRVARGLYQLLLPGLSRLRIQPTHLLPTGMKITSYNHHVRRLLSFREALVLKPRLPDSIEPSLLSNQGSRRVLGANLTCWAGWPSLWVPSRLKAAPPFVVFKGWVPRTLRAKPVHSPTNFEVPTLAKNARVDWIRAKARFELSMPLVRTKTAGQKGAFAHD